MRRAFVPSLALALLLAGNAFAQMPGKAATGNALTPQQITRELETAGFKNIAIVTSAYVVRATAPDGTTVSITFNPQQLRMFQPDAGLGPG